MFINLNVHSHYSLMSSVVNIDDLINHATKNNQTHVALVDINTMFGTMELYHKARANKLIPIIRLQRIWK